MSAVEAAPLVHEGSRHIDGADLRWRAVRRGRGTPWLPFAEIAENGDGTWSCWFVEKPGDWKAMGAGLVGLPDALSRFDAEAWLKGQTEGRRGA